MQHEKDPMLASHIGHFLMSSLGGSRLGAPHRSVEEQARGTLWPNISAPGPKAPKACLHAFKIPPPEVLLSEHADVSNRKQFSSTLKSYHN